MSGNLDKAKGAAKEKVGDLTDDPDLKNEGKVDRALGSVKDTADRLGDKVKDAIRRD